MSCDALVPDEKRQTCSVHRPSGGGPSVVFVQQTDPILLIHLVGWKLPWDAHTIHARTNNVNHEGSAFGHKAPFLEL